MSHVLWKLQNSIESTHAGLGRLLSFNVMAAIAKKCVLNVAVAGIGKSTVTWALKEAWNEQVKVFDSITRSGLKFISTEIANFDGVIIIDDLGKVDTSYSRMATITTMAELVYSHFVRKLTFGMDIDISDFFGSAHMNIQPVLLGEVAARPEWEAVIRDKTMRYYHFVRPTAPIKSIPKIKVKLKKNVQKVKDKTEHNDLYHDLIRIGLMQWSYARVKEHIHDMLKATAKIDRRNLVTETDKQVLFSLLQPLLIERFLMRKMGFETGISFDDNLACLLTEFCSFQPLTLAQICNDFKITPSLAKNILVSMKKFCVIEKHSEPVIVPTEFAKELLEQMGHKYMEGE